MLKSIYASGPASVNNKFDALKSVDHTNFLKFAGRIADQVEQDHHFLDHEASPWDIHRFHLIRAISRLGLDLYITPAVPSGHSRVKVEDLIHLLKCKVNHRRLGRDWHKKADQCLKGMVIFERSNGEHVHLVLRSPVDMTTEAFKDLITDIWANIVHHDCKVEPIHSATGLFGYLTKEMWDGNEIDSWKLLEDTRPLQKG